VFLLYKHFFITTNTW